MSLDLRRILIVVFLACIAAYAGEDTANTASPAAPSVYKGEDNSSPPPMPAASIVAPSSASSSATVYFYRPRHMVGAALAPSVYCDDVQLARIANGRYLVAKLPAGKHLLRSNDNKSGFEVDLKPDTEYFVNIDIVSGTWAAHGRTTLTSPEQGQNALKKFKAGDRENVINAGCAADSSRKR